MVVVVWFCAVVLRGIVFYVVFYAIYRSCVCLMLCGFVVCAQMCRNVAPYMTSNPISDIYIYIIYLAMCLFYPEKDACIYHILQVYIK